VRRPPNHEQKTIATTGMPVIAATAAFVQARTPPTKIRQEPTARQ
jgi:hypothetical protein